MASIVSSNPNGAFSNLLSFTGTTPNSYLYRGEQYDSNLGTYYLRARYHNPSTGRFASRDPKAGNPIEEEDPGRGPFEPEEPRDIVPGQAGAQH